MADHVKCLWCSTQFPPAIRGGQPKRFCSSRCQQEFNAGLRLWGRKAFDAGLVGVGTLKAVSGTDAAVHGAEKPKECGGP